MKLQVREFFIALVLIMAVLPAHAQKSNGKGDLYTSNRAPLVQQKFIPLPLGAMASA